MKKTNLQQKLREIHTLITRSMMTQENRAVSDDLLSDAEERLNELENEIACEADAN